jgi:hypothetical protein
MLIRWLNYYFCCLCIDLLFLVPPRFVIHYLGIFTGGSSNCKLTTMWKHSKKHRIKVKISQIYYTILVNVLEAMLLVINNYLHLP